MASPCAPCIFGAAQSNTLTFPSAIQTISVFPVTSTVFVGNASTVTTTTTTVFPSTTVPGVTSTETLSSGQAPTWIYSGATLTYPTIYVQYASFQGAAVTSGCATNVVATALTIPSSVPQASLIYPGDSTGGLPAALLSYLDQQPGFIGQLNNLRLEQCAAVPGAIPPTATQSSVTLTLTSTTTNTILTTQSSPPPPTTFAVSTQTSTATITTTDNASRVLSLSAIATVETFTGSNVFVSGAATITAQPVSLPAQMSSIMSVLSSSAAALSSAGIFANTTIASVNVPPSRTTSGVLYTGAAATQAVAVAGSFAGLLGLAIAL